MAATLVVSIWALIGLVLAGIYEYADEHIDAVHNFTDRMINKF